MYCSSMVPVEMGEGFQSKVKMLQEQGARPHGLPAAVRAGVGCWQCRDSSAASLSCLWCGRGAAWSERKDFPLGGRVKARQSC